MTKVLIVDDKHDNLITFQAVIYDSFPDLEPIVCDNGPEAIAIARQTQPDVVFLDIMMPGMDGFDVCRLLKADVETCDIPIVFVTAYGDLNDIKFRAIDSGSDGFLQKPIDIPNLIVMMRSMLRIRTANQEKRSERERLNAMISQKTSELQKAHRALLSLLEDLKRENETRRKAEAELAARGDYLYSVIQTTQDGFFSIARDGTIRETNKAFREMVGYADGFPADPPMLQNFDREHDGAGFSAILEELSALGHKNLRCFYTKRDGTRFPVELSASFLPGANPQFIFFCRDISERVRREEELRNLYEQFTHAQKMESIGRLAGGVAHDFNNMLGVILGQSELALSEIAPDNPMRGRFAEIRNASVRSSNLTRQLLAFARKQTITPKVIDINVSIESMIKMIQRLIGENIELSWVPAGEALPVFLDPGQLDQILANLCVNAKDAIGGIGRIAIRTARVSGNDPDRTWPAAVPRGDYAVLEVGDTGCGMDETVISRIFEPFFTTKELGKGTGLGLATVYGIVKQNNCHITVASEVGVGTMFRIFIPRHGEMARDVADETVRKAPAVSTGTLLVIEDEPVLLEMTTEMLESLGYDVIQASTPTTACELFSEHDARIDGILSDVILPEISGPELIRILRTQRPDVGVLYVSGYSPDEIIDRNRNQRLDGFLQKPFSRADLADKVRAMLAEAKKTACVGEVRPE